MQERTPTTNGKQEAPYGRTAARVKRIVFWGATGYVALALFYGGLAEVLDASIHLEASSIGTATVVAILGYPLYFVYLIGIGKMLGAVAILVPRFPRLKEWAYAGLVFNMTGALLSWLIVTVINGVPIPDGYGSPMFHVLNALHLLVLIVISWALRPEGRVLGTVFPVRATRPIRESAVQTVKQEGRMA